MGLLGGRCIGPVLASTEVAETEVQGIHHGSTLADSAGMRGQGTDARGLRLLRFNSDSDNAPHDRVCYRATQASTSPFYNGKCEAVSCPKHSTGPTFGLAVEGLQVLNRHNQVIYSMRNLQGTLRCPSATCTDAHCHWIALTIWLTSLSGSPSLVSRN